jgi:hypothetical protein
MSTIDLREAIKRKLQTLNPRLNSTKVPSGAAPQSPAMLPPKKLDNGLWIRRRVRTAAGTTLAVILLGAARPAAAQTTTTLATDAARLLADLKSNAPAATVEADAQAFEKDLGSGSKCLDKSCRSVVTWGVGPTASVSFARAAHVALNGALVGQAIVSTLLRPSGGYLLHFALQAGLGTGQLYTSGVAGSPFAAFDAALLIEAGESSGPVIGGIGISLMCPTNPLPHETRCFAGLASTGVVSSLAVSF